MSRPGDWNCKSCQHLNFQRRDSCQRCGDLRPAGDRSAADFGNFLARGASSFGFVSGPDVRPGDWYCSFGNCGAHNFASRSSCFKCGSLKDESSLGGGGGGSGGGGFDGDHLARGRGGFGGFGSGSSGGAGGGRSGWKSGDWICTRSGCNEHNFASRTECFRCSAPRESSSRSPY